MTCLGIKVDSKFSGNSSEAEMKDLGADVKMTAKRRIRRHLPVAKGPHTVGVVDIMCERGENGIFFRLYYPTTRTDIYVSIDHFIDISSCQLFWVFLVRI